MRAEALELNALTIGAIQRRRSKNSIPTSSPELETYSSLQDIIQTAMERADRGDDHCCRRPPRHQDGDESRDEAPIASPAAAYPSMAELVQPRRSCFDREDHEEKMTVGTVSQPSSQRYRRPPRRRSASLLQLRAPRGSAAGLASQPNTIQRFLAEYTKGKLLGQGSTGSVFTVTAKETGEQYACKFMKLDKAESEQSAAVVRKELHMLTVLSDHSKFVTLCDYFMNDRHCMIVMELLEGGDLHGYLATHRPSEDDCRTIVRNLLEGLAFLHTAGAAHRDLKLENIMFARKNDLSSLRIVDMGLSKFMHSSRHTVCGSPLFLAPEALLQTATSADGRTRARYDSAVDMWACGIILYIVLSGEQPYQAVHKQSLGYLLREIASCSISFDSPAWETVSPMALQLLKQMLHTDPKQRLGAQEALSHPWFGTAQ